MSKSLVGDVTVSKSLVGDVTVSKSLVGDVTVSKSLVGDVTVSIPICCFQYSRILQALIFFLGDYLGGWNE